MMRRVVLCVAIALLAMPFIVEPSLSRVGGEIFFGDKKGQKILSPEQKEEKHFETQQKQLLELQLSQERTNTLLEELVSNQKKMLKLQAEHLKMLKDEKKEQASDVQVIR